MAKKRKPNVDALRQDPVATVDPRVAEARRRMQAAQQQLQDKQASSPSLRGAKTGLFNASWLRHHLGHSICLAIAITFALLASTWCYYLLHVMFPLGRAVALPTGVVCAGVASYASAYFLAAIQIAFEGADEIDRMPGVEWREWFWSLPTTLSPLVMAGLVGYGLSLVVPEYRNAVILSALFLLYPFLLLSILETDSVLAPVSMVVVRSTFSQPSAWLAFYIQAAVIVAIVIGLTWISWRDPPFITLGIVGPFVAVGLVIYSRILGGLAFKLRKT